MRKSEKRKIEFQLFDCQGFRFSLFRISAFARQGTFLLTA
jgi:hypothetical protein